MDFLTTGNIAEKLNVDRDTVSYALRKMRIKPKGRAGQVRIFPKNVLATVKEFLDSKIERKV